MAIETTTPPFLSTGESAILSSQTNLAEVVKDVQPVVDTDEKITATIKDLMAKLHKKDAAALYKKMIKTTALRLFSELPTEKRIQFIANKEMEDKRLVQEKTKDEIYHFLDGYEKELTLSGESSERILKEGLRKSIIEINDNQNFDLLRITFKGYCALLRDPRSKAISARLLSNLKSKMVSTVPYDCIDSLKNLDFLLKSINWTSLSYQEKINCLYRTSLSILLMKNTLTLLLELQASNEKGEVLKLLSDVLKEYILNRPASSNKTFLNSLFDTASGPTWQEVYEVLVLISFNDEKKNSQLESFMEGERLTYFTEQTKVFKKAYEAKSRPLIRFRIMDYINDLY